MPSNDFSGELHRPLFTQIPIELFNSCAERGRRRLVFVYGWLWFYAGRADTAFPSVPRLALECGMKERDIRSALSTLLAEGWIIKTGVSSAGTNVYKIRTETRRRKRSPKPAAAQSKSAKPLPLEGTPLQGEPPTPVGESPARPPLPPGGTPPQGDPIKKPLNEEEKTQEGLIPIPDRYMSQGGEKISDAAPLVTTAEAVATDRDVVVTSAQNDAPQRHAHLAAADPGTRPAEQPPAQQAALPDFLKPHRPLLVEWARLRRSKHPTAPAIHGISPADLHAIHHAHALGVLQPFLEAAAASGRKSLATGYRRQCEHLRAGPEASAAFDALRSAYLAAPRRVTCQSLPAAQRELAAVLAEGHTIDQLLGALSAEIRAQEQQLTSTGFTPPLPDIVRWLKDRRFAAYLQQNQPTTASTAAEFVPPLDPETGAPDPFAYHRQLSRQ